MKMSSQQKIKIFAFLLHATSIKFDVCSKLGSTSNDKKLRASEDEHHNEIDGVHFIHHTQVHLAYIDEFDTENELQKAPSLLLIFCGPAIQKRKTFLTHMKIGNSCISCEQQETRIEIG